MRYAFYSKTGGYNCSDKLSFEEICNAEWVYDGEQNKYIKNRHGDADAPAPYRPTSMIVQKTLVFWEYEDGNV